MSDFPPSGVINKEDGKHYSYNREDNTVTADTEGGYKYTRPRSTRAPRRTWTTGWTSITLSEFQLIDDFYESTRAGAEGFTWTDPVRGTEHVVRFVGDLSPSYGGVGQSHLFGLKVNLEEV